MVPHHLTRRTCVSLLAPLLGLALPLAAQDGPILSTRPPKPADSSSSDDSEAPVLSSHHREGEADDSSVIHVDVALVNLYFTVRRSGSNELVPNLTQNDFTVFEDGKPQTIAHFSRETNLPLELGMLIDVSGSQTNLIETERHAGSEFFKDVIRPKDEAFLLSFGHETTLVQDFTNSVPKLQSGLDSLKGDVAAGQYGNRGGGSGNGGGGYPSGGGGGMSWPGGGMGWPGGGGMGRRRGGYPGSAQQRGNRKGTLMFDAVYLAANEVIGQKQGRKALFLITDGEDRGSYYTRSQAIEAAQRANTIIYSIYYVDPRLYQRRGGSDDMRGPEDLNSMSEETGGRVFRVSQNHTLEDVFTEIQAEMRSQYSLAYKSTNSDRNGEFREVEIRAKNADDRVQGRKGYYATKSRTS